MRASGSEAERGRGRRAALVLLAAGALLLAAGFGARRFVEEGPGRGPFFRYLVRESIRHGDGPKERIPGFVAKHFHRFAGNVEAVLHALGGALLLAGAAALAGRRLAAADVWWAAAVLLALAGLGRQFGHLAAAGREGLLGGDEERLRERFFDTAAQVLPRVEAAVPDGARFLVTRWGADPEDVVMLGYLAFPRRLCTPSAKVPPVDHRELRRLLAENERVRRYLRSRRYTHVVDYEALVRGEEGAIVPVPPEGAAGGGAR